MSIDPIETELGEGLPSNVIDDNESNIVNIHPSNTWATWRMELVMSGFSQLRASSQNSRGTKRKWVPEENVALVACMVDLIRTLKRDWTILYDMLSGKDNSNFGWDEHRQMVVAEDADGTHI
ncbi:hypothetical protein Godav_025806 [Gossypium davidsonii]|uniref:Myb/SANT-like domain-containing protein n=3 Tax=Gossypium TaxID=3633 RepID=A0A7J8T8V6_GOSDV|nr:hypothetical protein [Gossypium davidsonii]MBA0671568.1 hypothetical protein [Gossypium klotzschianum]